MSKDVMQVSVGVAMNISGCKTEWTEEIPRAEWDAMTADEQEQRLREIADAAMDNEVHAWAYVKDGD